MQLETQGLHPATELCLEVLQGLSERYDFARVLDMGCGNGILSVVAAGVWGAEVVAADISPKAVEDTSRNAAAHGLSELITPIRSDGFSAPLIQERAPYDLILFNVLAEPIIRMARSMQGLMEKDGIAVLGGILAWQAEEVRAAVINLGFEIAEEFNRHPWYLAVICNTKNSDVTKP